MNPEKPKTPCRWCEGDGSEKHGPHGQTQYTDCSVCKGTGVDPRACSCAGTGWVVSYVEGKYEERPCDQCAGGERFPNHWQDRRAAA